MFLCKYSWFQAFYINIFSYSIVLYKYPWFQGFYINIIGFSSFYIHIIGYSSFLCKHTWLFKRYL